MTSGEAKGTSGWSRVEWKPLAFVALGGVIVAITNATSRILESQRDTDGLYPAAPFLWEFSSLIVALALAPMVGEAIRRLAPQRDNIARFVLGHLAMTLPFSIVHVAAMVGLRKLGYAAFGESYDFSHGAPLREFFYEWRKDVLTYAVIAAIYWFFQWRAERPPPARPGDDRIEIRDGGSAVFLPPTDILAVEAAGNYVEFHTSTRTHLVRGTLATWEARLAARGFVRVHRSRLINRARITALKPTPSGDVEITLEDGRTLLGSRRYRAALEQN